MSLRGKELLKKRDKAMEARKKRYQDRQHELVDTLPEIAAKLKNTHMITGKIINSPQYFLVRKGKTYALLNDHASKKRKLDAAAYQDQNGAYKDHIADLESQI